MSKPDFYPCAGKNHKKNTWKLMALAVTFRRNCWVITFQLRALCRTSRSGTGRLRMRSIALLKAGGLLQINHESNEIVASVS